MHHFRDFIFISLIGIINLMNSRKKGGDAQSEM